MHSHAQDFADAESFIDYISTSWHREWQRVYSADWEASIPFKDGGVDYRVTYTPTIKLLSILTQGACKGGTPPMNPNSSRGS